jgi:DNA polymerase-3 subunit delta
MIIKSFELNKIEKIYKKKILLYGENQGHKTQVIEEIFKKHYSDNIYYYEENEIISNEENFFNNLLSGSFFEKEKLIIINRATDKIKGIIEEIITKKIEDVVLVLNSNALEKKSKLRSLFEKSSELICVPFYEDNNQTLSNVVSSFFRQIQIPISQQAINLIVERSRGDRQNLKNELEKIGHFAKNKGKISMVELLKLTNLAENYNVSELVDNCLAKNIKRTINILNENNYSPEDCILIIRTFLIKSKRLIKLCGETQQTKDVDSIISRFKPPIFWKDKEIVKKQIMGWSYKNAENLVYEASNIELLIKKHSTNSLNILSNFIIEKVSSVNS